MDNDDDDKNLFQKSVEQTTRLKPNNKLNYRPRPKPIRRPVVGEDDEQKLDVNLDIKVPNVSGETSLYYHRGGLQTKLLRSLRQGKLHIEAELDLHGLTLEEAEQAITAFILMAKQHQLRFLHIIHGKGHRGSIQSPALKNMVNQFLQQIPDVLAFCSAPRNQGGTGALNIIIKTS